jgi:hypothetical protein
LTALVDGILNPPRATCCERLPRAEQLLVAKMRRRTAKRVRLEGRAYEFGRLIRSTLPVGLPEPHSPCGGVRDNQGWTAGISSVLERLRHFHGPQVQKSTGIEFARFERARSNVDADQW